MSTNPADLQPGDHVQWNWGRGHPQGVVSKVSPSHMEETIAGKTITRNGDEENPAVFVEREEKGKNPVVKKASELTKLEDE
ncbi:hypothetical protein HDU85_001615 [Gaertneriomyces sp. JEL0708]|nr:hypothetical protein HDU85_001615 [Gaertneriomyces sp. JEL0708]